MFSGCVGVTRPGSTIIYYNTCFQIAWGLPGRALLTVPPQFRVGWSSIPGAGMGVFTKTFIRKHTWLAEYEGRLFKYDEKLLKDRNFRDYSWRVRIIGSHYGNEMLFF